MVNGAGRGRFRRRREWPDPYGMILDRSHGDASFER